MSDRSDLAAARQFVLELGRAMHALGSPSYRVEDAMEACARTLGCTRSSVVDGSAPRGPSDAKIAVGVAK